MNAIGPYLKKVRLQQELSLYDVFLGTGITDSKLSRIENDRKITAISPSDLVSLAKLYDIGVVELFIKAGYLDEEALSAYEQVFRNVRLLLDDERKHIQEQIYLFTKERKHHDI